MMSLIITPQPVDPDELESDYQSIIAAANRCGWGNSLDIKFEENKRLFSVNSKHYAVHQVSCESTEQVVFGVAFLTFALFEPLQCKRLAYRTSLRCAVEKALGYVRSTAGQNIDVVHRTEDHVTIAYGNCNWQVINERMRALEPMPIPELQRTVTLQDYLGLIPYQGV